VLTDKEKNADVIVNLTETETEFLFFKSSSVNAMTTTDPEKLEEIKKKNSEYEKHMKEKQGSDLFANRATETFSLLGKP